jgi:hypothetical protein
MSVSPPSALFDGPTKSGTTWHHACLQARGDVALPGRMKPIAFFDKVPDRLFPDAGDTRKHPTDARQVIRAADARPASLKPCRHPGPIQFI